MANPREQIDVAAIAAQLEASRLVVEAELAKQAELIQILGGTATSIESSPSGTVEEKPLFPGLYSTVESQALVPVENYVSSNSLRDTVEGRISPYRLSLLEEFRQRSATQKLMRPLRWTAQNHPILYNYSLNKGHELQLFNVTQFFAGDSGASSLATDVSFEANTISGIKVAWQTGYQNPQFPDVLCENLGSRDPRFDERYRKLVGMTFQGRPTTRPKSNLIISGLRSDIANYRLSFERPGDGVATYKYDETLADGPAFVLAEHTTRFTGPRTDPDTISINEFLGWLDFALGTIPPSDLPNGPRQALPPAPEQE